MDPHRPPPNRGNTGDNTDPGRDRQTLRRALVLIAALAAVGAVILTAAVLRPSSNSPAPAASQEHHQGAPHLDLPPGALTKTVAAMPDRPEIVWRATPESLGLGDALEFNVGTRGQDDGVILVGDLVVTRYNTIANLRPDIIADFGNPNAPRNVSGLVGIDSTTGRVRWALDVYSARYCFHVEETTSAVCQAQKIPPGWPHSEEYGAFDIVDLTSGTVTGRTALPIMIQAIRETDGRIISFSALPGGDVAEIAAGSLADPRADWATRVPRRADEPVRAGTLEHIDAEAVPLTAEEEERELATGCTIRSSGEDAIIGSSATVREGRSPVVDLTTGTPVDTPTAAKVQVSPGGTAIASAACPNGWDQSTQSDDLDWVYQRLDGLPLPGIEGYPITGFKHPLRSIVADVTAADLPVFTSKGAYSLDGKPLWNWPVGGRLYGNEAIAVAGDTVVVAGVISRDKGLMRGYDLQTGQEIWHADPPLEENGGFPHFVSTDGTRVFTTNGAAISLRSGQTEWDLEEFPEPPPLPDVFAEFGPSSAFTQWGEGMVVHSNQREIIAYR
ncbi:hypothetical protein ABIE38_003494 [Dietzia sp. 2505]|uniref:outer membrane protein assembly factor BamB family protein n=1 Tax=Dietzia sp. 2505 TaxID=3156457 RepID=UPI0033972005